MPAVRSVVVVVDRGGRHGEAHAVALEVAVGLMPPHAGPAG